MRHVISWAVSRGLQLTGKNSFKVLGMVKQVELPTFFITLNCADLQRDELIKGKLKGEELKSERISSMD